MSRFYSPADANALVPELAMVVGRLRDQRAELVGLRDAYRALETATLQRTISEAPPEPSDEAELRRLQLQMRGLVDQMAADAAWLDERSIVLRDIATGLLDFPAMAEGRQVWLCWRLGEDAVRHWHELETGFAGRRALADR